MCIRDSPGTEFKISFSLGILECSIPLDFASLAKDSAFVKLGSSSNKSFTPTPYFA